ncbi:amidohydrolase [Acetobacter nitrogenifigens DSM 23921 = NBRC 105050]|uniref:Ethylammeline chlorohydrolase n=1 Tax=Acetobacter nitrogenifigens DSM 23921 = NBRC 105050 TaxID=1120919 RepID=A0A511X8P4_9PROT|nr:amidohydrolase family protein [Acetobacter nitrogenifigens]GBQ87607.1 amidohydrolase [Acetobacter nitrogenifigens DSM 23921 = NBRC 105050]GEN59304.1 ethylammeline chlorohydrolase [Acetobacter nitrogenifigens DSM 23921 = NBRC 105050]
MTEDGGQGVKGRPQRFANLSWAVLWDEVAGGHVYARNVDLVVRDGRIVFAGPAAELPGEYAGLPVDVDGTGLMAMPGFVNIHSHPATEPMNRGLFDELGSPGLYYSSLYEYMPVFRSDARSKPDCARVAYSEMLLSGVTTVVDLSTPWDGWLDVAAESGLRVCLAPMFRSAAWRTDDGHTVSYSWLEDDGRRGMAEALEIVDAARGHACGRLMGMVAPAQIDTCSEELLKASFVEADKRDIAWQTHAAQSIVEFHEITRRHGMTPIQWLHHLGVLSPRSIVGHGIFLDDNPSTPWHTKTDLSLLADDGASVAHCPTVFARRGYVLRDFGRYRKAGVRLGIGTDTYPHTILDDLRLAAYLGRVQAGSPTAVPTRAVFDAVTVAGAAMLRRDDLGRLAVGGCADIVLVDLKHPMMQPSIDPVRSLIVSCDDRAIHSVYVGGRKAVEAGRVLTMDYVGATERLVGEQARIVGSVAERDRLGRSAETLIPSTFPIR